MNNSTCSTNGDNIVIIIYIYTFPYLFTQLINYISYLLTTCLRLHSLILQRNTVCTQSLMKIIKHSNIYICIKVRQAIVKNIQ